MLPYTVIAPFDNLIELADVSDVDSFRTFTSDGEHLDDLRFDFASPSRPSVFHDEICDICATCSLPHLLAPPNTFGH